MNWRNLPTAAHFVPLQFFAFSLSFLVLFYWIGPFSIAISRFPGEFQKNGNETGKLKNGLFFRGILEKSTLRLSWICWSSIPDIKSGLPKVKYVMKTMMRRLQTQFYFQTIVVFALSSLGVTHSYSHSSRNICKIDEDDDDVKGQSS